MKQFLSFVRKEFIHILRDPRSLLIVPTIYLSGMAVLQDKAGVRHGGAHQNGGRRGKNDASPPAFLLNIIKKVGRVVR